MSNKPGRRSNTNANDRGNTTDRARRREFLIDKFGFASGRAIRKYGVNAPKTLIACYHCKRVMQARPRNKYNMHTWEVDRFPLCKHLGGRYTRDNIVPACWRCNGGRCTRKGATCAASEAQLRLVAADEVPF